MKRNTTPVIGVKINIDYEIFTQRVEKIEFVFKDRRESWAKTLVYKVYEGEDIEVLDNCDDWVKVKLSLTAEDTVALPAGEVFMDTKITLQGGVIPETNVIQLNVQETLFEEMMNSD